MPSSIRSSLGGVILDDSLTFRLDPEAALAQQEAMQPAVVR